MIAPDRVILSFSAVFLAFVAACLPGVTVKPAFAATRGVPPFCVMRGGSDGPGGSPQLCSYYDYQACLQAAADLRGNCVQNIDYHGEVSTAPVAPVRAARHRR
jgi:hypothetical protein